MVSLGGGYRAHLRHADLVDAPPSPDRVLDASVTDDEAIDAAVRAAHQKGAARPASKPSVERVAAWRPDAAYKSEPYPSRERRILALFRFWNVIRYFYPYLR